MNWNGFVCLDCADFDVARTVDLFEKVLCYPLSVCVCGCVSVVTISVVNWFPSSLLRCVEYSAILKIYFGFICLCYINLFE